MNWQTESLGNLLAPAGSDRAGEEDLPVLSITMQDGLVDQSTKFKKRIASRDISTYRVVYTNELVVGFPIDEGVLGFQTKYRAAVVSPAYGIWKLRKPKETHIPFVERYLRSGEARQIYARAMRGAVARRRSISREAFLEITIPFPPLDEQKRIAAVLEKIDALRRGRKEFIQQSERLLQSVFINMFGEPVQNSKHLPTEELPHLAKLERGKFTPRPRNDPSYYGGHYPFIQTGDITRSRGRITSWTQTLNEKGVLVSKRFDKGTVVIAIVGATLGETAIVETPVYCPDSIIGLTPYPKKATSEFIEFLLRLWKPRLKQLAPDAARANLNLERLRPLPALAPPIEEQREFSRIAVMLRSLVLANQESETELDRLFLSVQHRTFSGDLDISRLVLGSGGEEPSAHVSQPPETKVAAPPINTLRLKAPDAVMAVLNDLSKRVNGGEQVPWSADYFKYRILASQSIPFSFNDVMQKADSVFDDPPYEEIKDMIMDLLGKGGNPALLTQTFDLNIDATTKETSGRKEIVFGRPA
jgi:type I restriction enzyme S subunit